jgi:hypothetical protein
MAAHTPDKAVAALIGAARTAVVEVYDPALGSLIAMTEVADQ